MANCNIISNQGNNKGTDMLDLKELATNEVSLEKLVEDILS